MNEEKLDKDRMPVHSKPEKDRLQEYATACILLREEDKNEKA